MTVCTTLYLQKIISYFCCLFQCRCISETAIVPSPMYPNGQRDIVVTNTHPLVRLSYCIYWFKFHWSLGSIIKKSALIRVMVCHTIISTNAGWVSFMMHIYTSHGLEIILWTLNKWIQSTLTILLSTCTYHCQWLSEAGVLDLYLHYSEVIVGAMTSQITSLTIVYSTVYSGADQRKHQSSASLAFVRGIHQWPVNSPHKWPVTRKMFPFDDVIMGNPSSIGSVEGWWPELHGNNVKLKAMCIFPGYSVHTLRT